MDTKDIERLKDNLEKLQYNIGEVIKSITTPKGTYSIVEEIRDSNSYRVTKVLRHSDGKMFKEGQEVQTPYGKAKISHFVPLLSRKTITAWFRPEVTFPTVSEVFCCNLEEIEEVQKVEQKSFLVLVFREKGVGELFNLIDIESRLYQKRPGTSVRLSGGSSRVYEESSILHNPKEFDIVRINRLSDNTTYEVGNKIQTQLGVEKIVRFSTINKDNKILVHFETPNHQMLLDRLPVKEQDVDFVTRDGVQCRFSIDKVYVIAKDKNHLEGVYGPYMLYEHSILNPVCFSTKEKAEEYLSSKYTGRHLSLKDIVDIMGSDSMSYIKDLEQKVEERI